MISELFLGVSLYNNWNSYYFYKYSERIHYYIDGSSTKGYRWDYLKSHIDAFWWEMRPSKDINIIDTLEFIKGVKNEYMPIQNAT